MTKITIIETGFTITKTLLGKEQCFFKGVLLSEGNPNKYRALKYVEASNTVMLNRYINFWTYELEILYKEQSDQLQGFRKGFIEALLLSLHTAVEVNQKALRASIKVGG